MSATLLHREATLFCLPHAGGGASAFRGWADALDARIAVKILQLPGRESRFREPPLVALDDVLTDLYPLVASAATQPFAIFGHSMGGLLAFELAHMLRRRTGREPVALFVSACRAPQFPQVSMQFSALSQADFIAELSRRYGGIPAEILSDRGYMDAILPAFRADFGILEGLPTGRTAATGLPDFGVRWHTRYSHSARGPCGLEAADHREIQFRHRRWKPLLSAVGEDRPW